MPAKERDVRDLLALAERHLEELRALRKQSIDQTDLLRQLLARVKSFERTQYA
jgi:hypothetical protein